MRKLIKYLRFIKKISKRTEVNIPILTTLCVTHKCNLNCVYCYRDKSIQKDLTTQEILQLIDDLYVKGMRYISLNGGEPLLREDLPLIIKKIRQKNILCHISTNGLLVPQSIQLLKLVDSIALSLDGLRKSNDDNRGEDSYSKVIDAIDCLKSNKIKFYVHTVLTKNNTDAVDEMMTLSRAYDFKVQFSFLRENSFIDNSIALTDIEIKQRIKQIIEYKENGYKVFFSKETYMYMLNYPHLYGELLKCRVKDIACHIESDGRVYPCVVLVDKFKALNFLDVGLDQALDNLKTNTCVSCNNACCTDLNYLFSFNPGVIINSIKNAI